MKKKTKKILGRAKMFLIFSVLVFITTITNLACVFFFYEFVGWVPFLDIEKMPRHFNEYALVLISIILGILLSLFFKKFILDPIYNVYNAVDSISEGEYCTEIEPKGVKAVKILAKKINSMAKELNSIETMRSDFVDNFSHEFKTPIISIEGFAKILKNESLSQEEKHEYLDIIINESRRLSELSANILNLTKLEHQTILSQQENFNVSEQIRLVVVLLENKWSKKNIEISFEGEDYTITANKALLQQLWTNIIDNAFKYSPKDTRVAVTAKKKNRDLIVRIQDSGSGMNDTQVKHAFDKFYQGDISHKSTGNGIGLTVARKICDLHGGNIRIKSTGPEGTVFEVVLPIND